MKYTQDFKIPEVLISNFEGIICFEILSVFYLQVNTVFMHIC